MSNLTEEEFKRLNDCKTEDEWGEACLAVTAARGGKYPSDWLVRMLRSGLMKEIFARFGQSADFQVQVIPTRSP